MSVNATSNVVAGGETHGAVVVPEDYLRLIERMPLWPIESAAVHRRALALINELLGKKAKNGKLSRAEAGYLSVLIELAENYEKATIPRRTVPDGEMLAHLIEGKGVTQAQVERDTGIAAPTISAIIAGRRRLTRDQIGKLSTYFGVKPNAFAFDG
jgi:HTH-type transcriptional regulator / antitoxin HigA